MTQWERARPEPGPWEQRGSDREERCGPGRLRVRKRGGVKKAPGNDEGPQAKECRQPLEAGEGKGTDSSASGRN